MPRQLSTRGPVQIREFVPQGYDAIEYQERSQLVSRARIVERGPDVAISVFSRALPAGTLTVAAQDQDELLARLFGEHAPFVADSLDRELLGRVLDAHEEACMAGHTLSITETRRIVWTYLTALITDHHELARLKDGERGAA